MFVLLILLICIGIGTLLRRYRIIRILEHTATWTVWLIIFVFGISLGSDSNIISDFPHFGFTAFLIALAGVAGSILAAWALRSFIDQRKK